MNDVILRAISPDGQVKGFAAVTTQLVQELQRRQNSLPIASAALGRTATMVSIMGRTLKKEQHRVSIRVDGDGPLEQIFVDSDGAGNVRGYVDHPDVLLPNNAMGKLDVAQAVGKGTIYVIKDFGLKEPYRGTSPIVSGELAEDFTYYFSTSEQVPSSVGLGVLVKRDQILASGGYMVQVLPGATEETIEQLEQRIALLRSISKLLEEQVTPADLLRRIMGDEIQILEEYPVRFSCNCSAQKTSSMLKSLGKTELKAIIEEEGQAEVVCHFCGEKYFYKKQELLQLLAELSWDS